ncbi:uncharacterized protein LOC103930106 [Pyrus x bretschneideri]|uniref:uncharacterized protein LOC103930106 n=1 Tax=Pyrus x bretschneideri TaxID=225117 RepID=UPI0005109107|nr:uncharacterized protein LOC103930106 [Pyrus x bretschneideri]
MEASKKGYAWAVSAGLCAASAAVSAKLITNQIVKYCFVVLFNVTMWGCFVQSLKNLSSLQATATNFATNFLTSGLAGYFLFQEPLSEKWFAGALLIVIGALVLSKSSIEKNVHTD